MLVHPFDLIDVVIRATEEEAVVGPCRVCTDLPFLQQSLPRCGRRIRIGHIHKRCDSARYRCPAFRGDGSFVRQSRLAEMNLVVYTSGE